jgi:hypothetical protein
MHAMAGGAGGMIAMVSFLECNRKRLADPIGLCRP